MGNHNSNVRTLSHGSHDNDDENRFREQFYRACETGDLSMVRQLLPHLSHKRVNQIQYEEKSVLDAAAANGHQNIVQYLLDYDYYRGRDRFIEHDLNDCFAFQPSFESVRQHISFDHAQSSQLFMSIANTGRLARPFVCFAVKQQCVDNLTEIIEATRRIHGDQNCKDLNELYEAFLKHHKFDALIKIFTLATPQMSTILRRNSGSYSALIYLNLHKFQDRAFKGLSYRGLRESPLNLEHYRSAMKHGHIIELKNLTSTSKLEAIAEIYKSDRMVRNAYLMIIKFDFTECRCPTALDLTKDPCISRIPDEEEVLVLPHTLFRVTDIHHISITEDNPCKQFTITLKYVPVIDGRTLNSFVWEGSHLE